MVEADKRMLNRQGLLSIYEDACSFSFSRGGDYMPKGLAYNKYGTIYSWMSYLFWMIRKMEVTGYATF